MPPHVRQGDLLFLRQDTRLGRVIVAGEATGHAHRLQAGTILHALGGGLCLEVTQTTQVVHEEHGPISLDPGLWLVMRQREYSPEALRTVAD